MKKTIILFFLAALFLASCTEDTVNPKDGSGADPNGKPYRALNSAEPEPNQGLDRDPMLVVSNDGGH